MRIAVYSGTFDPLHIGHQAIMEHLTNNKGFDWVYLVVSPQNPFKQSGLVKSGEQRYKAAVEAVRRHPELHVWVDDIELHMEPPHYTIRTLEALKKREPENEFTLVIGADNLDSIRKWRDFPRILSEFGVAVYPRAGYDVRRIRERLHEECKNIHMPAYVLDNAETHDLDGTSSLEDDRANLYQIQIIDAPLCNISSTEIREAQARGIDMSKYLM